MGNEIVGNKVKQKPPFELEHWGVTAECFDPRDQKYHDYIELSTKNIGHLNLKIYKNGKMILDTYPYPADFMNDEVPRTSEEWIKMFEEAKKVYEYYYGKK